MQCHRCQHRRDVEAGRYRNVPYEKTPCAGCELKEFSGFTIEYDDERAPLSPEPMAEENDERLPMSVMREAVVTLLELAPQLRDIICWRFAGLKYRDIAVLLGVTMAAVEIRHRRALRRCPALRALFAEKLAKQKRRKPYGWQRRRRRREG